MSATIHVIGSMMIDRVVRVRALPRAGETVPALSSATFAGGKGANQAAAAAKCGARVRMLGRTGRDGAFIVEALRESGVDVDAVSTADPVSGSATVLVAESGENAIVIAPESNTRLVMPDVEVFLAKAEPGEIVLFQNECSYLHEAISHAALRVFRVWLNAAPADALLDALKYEKLTGLVVNETEAEALTGERDPARALEMLAERMPHGTVIVTLGAQGAIAAAGRARYAHRGFEVDAVDTVGCGDAFVGAYLAAVSQGRDIVQALARANAAGALAAMRAGAIPSLPSLGEVEVVAELPERSRLRPRPALESAPKLPSRCPACGYRLVGKSAGERCPECGGIIVDATRAHGTIDARALSRLANAARLLFGAGIVLAITPVIDHFTDIAAFVAVFVIATAQVSLQSVASLMLASFAPEPRRRRRLRELAVVRAAAFSVGQLLYPALVLLGWPIFEGLLEVLAHPQIAPLFFLPVPLLVLAADAILLWWLRDLVEGTGARSGQPWRAAASKARYGILLALPLATLFAPVGFSYLPTMWGVCLALGAMEVLGAASAAMRRLDAAPRSAGPA
jgi:ribokinase